MEADYVIIGAGSAGSALTYRLSEDGKYSVMVLEFGGTDAGPFIQMPGALSYPMNMARYDWGFQSEPEPHLGGRRLAVPRGKVIGGSSSINGMVYVRGHSEDYQLWAEMGADGWGYADVLPYFKRMEHWESGGWGGDPDWRGKNGPLFVSRGPRDNPLHEAFIEAGVQAGFEATDDYNGAKPEGFGPMDATIRNGQRWSAANAYLKPALKRDNVELVRCFVRRVIIEDSRATGVEVDLKGQRKVISARREVIVAASSINSPKILMLSGIGPAKHLAEHGLTVVADRLGVGANLQDHMEVYMQQASKLPVTLFKHWNLIGKAKAGLHWLVSGKGIGASNHFEAAGFIRSRAGVKYPDIQFHFLPMAVRYDGKAVAEGHGYQVHVGPMRAASRGSVRLKSGNADDDPVIRFNYMAEEQDWIDFRHCVRVAREVLEQPAFAPYRSHEIMPGEAVQSDDQIDEFLREHAESAYHPCGTCKMGRRDDPMAVVDPKGSVIGVKQLRVVDSSIFPRITNGNLNAPSIMVGEKLADDILGKVPLAPENVAQWVNPRWKISDR
ncbi:MAG: choline dehydrogenase [Paracoccaceae bacterium]